MLAAVVGRSDRDPVPGELGSSCWSIHLDRAHATPLTIVRYGYYYGDRPEVRRRVEFIALAARSVWRQGPWGLHSCPAAARSTAMPALPGAPRSPQRDFSVREGIIVGRLGDAA